jgi:metallo-beta-lactamase family protein
MSNSITFFGAARTVTGSKHLIRQGKTTILVDCGMFQGPKELRDRNYDPFLFDPAELDAVILTHAHTDHIGMLPALVREGYKGPIYATGGTIGLCRISLPDSARIQAEDARYASRHNLDRPQQPLYTEADAQQAIRKMQRVPYHQWQDLPGKMTFRFLPAGHILGSAFIDLYFQNGERLVMSGDIGRKDRPILKDPEEVDGADYLVMESTYGDRLHEPENPLQVLEDVMDRALRERRIIIVPSFAIGRTQELLWCINELQNSRRVAKMPIYIDSPMANAATLLYARTDEDWDDDTKISILEGETPFSPELVQFVRDRHLSKALNNHRGPMMIIAGSGMASGGRIVHHLKHHLASENTIVLFTGFQAQGTLGRKIVEGAEWVDIMGDSIPVRAEIIQMGSLSAHADQGEMLDWMGGFKTVPKQTFLVHGEAEAQNVFAQKIREEKGWNVEIPEQGQTFSLGH